jgi:hypothetical protein
MLPLTITTHLTTAKHPLNKLKMGLNVRRIWCVSSCPLCGGLWCPQVNLCWHIKCLSEINCVNACYQNMWGLFLDYAGHLNSVLNPRHTTYCARRTVVSHYPGISSDYPIRLDRSARSSVESVIRLKLTNSGYNRGCDCATGCPSVYSLIEYRLSSLRVFSGTTGSTMNN